MKRLVISAVMALLALSTAVFSYYDVRKNCDSINTSLENAVTAIRENDTAECRTSLENAASVWEKCRGRFEFYLYSEELFEIDMNFERMKKLSDTFDAEELTELCRENINHIGRLAENQTPSLKKIF